MASWQAHLWSTILRLTFKPKLARAKNIQDVRSVMDRSFFKPPADIRITQARVGQSDGEWVEATKPAAAILLYLHGGGYIACTAATHRPYTTAFAKLGFRVYAPEYRLAPEHPFPAGLDDAVAAYRALRLANPDTPIVIAGDSAGGGLALATMLRLRDDHDALPSAAVLFSPFTDLTGSGASRQKNDKRCAMFYAKGLDMVLDYYLADKTDARHPLVSPLFADFKGLPPMLIHVGGDETLLDDSTQLADKARAAGIRVELKIWPVVSHVWQLLSMPEAKASLNEAAAFLRREVCDIETVIIGSGFAGLCMAIQLRKAGRESFMILEKGADIGGTWRDNTYPGCACDIPSHLYSFSFDLNPEWTRMYPSQPEIWKYMHDVVDRYHLRSAIRFHAEVTEAIFDEPSNTWLITTAAGLKVRARFVVFATGPLSKPALPNIAGLERFKGKIFHSAQWDHGHSLRGDRVAVIGTGASAIQFIPHLAEQARQVHLFQRTPPWILPRMDRAISSLQKSMFRHIPGYMRLFRTRIYLRQELLAPGFAGNRKWMEKPEQMARDHIAEQVQDTALRQRLTPNYQLGCKRVLISNEYYPALARPNVEVVTDAVTEIREHSVVTADGREREVDTLVCATGFRVTDFLAPTKILGRNGADLTALWQREGAQAHYGMTVAGYPNLFVLVGPNTGLGHNSILFMIEAQVRYVIECLDLLADRKSIEVEPAAQQKFNEEIHGRLSKAVWSAGGCKSWYLDEYGRNPTLWPGSTLTYWHETRHVNAASYRIVGS